MKENKKLNIVISGANEGIGYFMVESFLKQGHSVFVLDIHMNRLETLSKSMHGQRLMFDLCDVSQENQIEKSLEHIIKSFGHIDYLIHNACQCTFNSFDNENVQTFKHIFDVNFFSAIHLMKWFLPMFNQQKKGCVFITSSGVGVMGFRKISPYAASKGALESLVKCLNIEYSDRYISFHLIHPPLTKTNASKGLPIPSEFMADPKKVGYGISKRIHKKRRIITCSIRNRLTVGLMYLMPVSMGKFLSKMTKNYEHQKAHNTSSVKKI